MAKKLTVVRSLSILQNLAKAAPWVAGEIVLTASRTVTNAAVAADTTTTVTKIHCSLNPVNMLTGFLFAPANGG